MLNIIVHFELGNIELLESLMANTRRWLRTKRDLYQTEIVIFSHLRKWMNAISRKDQYQVWLDLWDEIQKIKTQPKEQRVFNYFNVLAWVLSKKDKITFEDAYKS